MSASAQGAPFSRLFNNGGMPKNKPKLTPKAGKACTRVDVALRRV
jgi:hypothetical protein